MKKITTGGFILPACLLACLLLVSSCSKNDSTPAPPADPCAGKTIIITATLTNTNSGASTGSIAAAATGSTGFTFSLNNGTHQATGTFSGLAAGTYNVSAMDGGHCITTKSFVIGTNDACIGKTFTVTGAVTSSDPCAANGSIVITAAGGTGFSYSLNNGTYGSANTFANLAPGAYTLNAKDGDGCIKSVTATIGASAAGATFAPVRAILQTNCAVSGCHTGAGAQNGINFSDDCVIVSNWDRIKARAVDCNPSVMPPAPKQALSATDKQKILDWITAGHKYVD
ncbi:MAG: Ig-like domain-containing protein [Bacteroidota bacterium]